MHMISRVTDSAQVQEVRNSLAEGMLILRTGKLNGRTLSRGEMWMVRKAVENSSFRLGESNLCFADGQLYKVATADVMIEDVTPDGYGPSF